MPGLKITLLQQPLVWMDGPANLRHFDRQLEEVSGRDIIVLPEMFTTGFAMEAAKQSMPQEEVVEWMQAKAEQTNALIAGSAALQTERGSVNRFLLVEPGGKTHFYDKRHLFRMADEHHHYEAGTERVVFEWRGWRILPLVCYDLRFPVWSRNHNDYDLALYVANWPAPRRCTGNRCWSPELLKTRPTSPAATASAPMATATTIGVIAVSSARRERLSPPPNRIRRRGSMPICRWPRCRSIARNFRPGRMPILSRSAKHFSGAAALPFIPPRSAKRSRPITLPIPSSVAVRTAKTGAETDAPPAPSTDFPAHQSPPAADSR